MCEKVLVIGAGDGGVIRELAQLSRDSSTSTWWRSTRWWWRCAKSTCRKTACRLDDPRLTIHYEDGLKFVRS